MPQSEYNLYRNAAFGNGRFGHIQLRAGGNQEVAAKDTIDINDVGILIHHNDDRESLTLIPWGNIGLIRTLSPEKKSWVTAKELEDEYSDEELREIGP